MTLPPETLDLLNDIVAAANDALAEDLVAIDVTERSPFSDVFLIMTADNPRHLRAVRSNLMDDVRKRTGRSPLSVEGEDDSEWLLLDYGDVVVHIFLGEARGFYALDKLWSLNPRVDVETPMAKAS